MKKILIFVALIGLIGCEGKEAKQARLNEVGFKYSQDIVKNSLIDPESAQFKNQKGFCGEVNAKNKMGGYTGFDKFIVLNPSTVVYENEQNISTKQFPTAWKEICSQKFNFDEDKPIAPKFNMPDAVYEKPKYEVTGGSVTATPKGVVMMPGGIYVYPRLTIRCMSGKTSFILLSFQTPSHTNNGRVGLVDEKIKDIIDVPFTGVEGVQEFTADGSVNKLLANAKDLMIYFKASGDSMSMQKYDMVEIRKLMRQQDNECGWVDL